MAVESTTVEISNDPADYITGPRKGEANRTNGGTTQDGKVTVIKGDADGDDDSK